jgi:SAM-dependent methyltransferase
MLDPNVLLHEERTELLRRMPAGAATILSAGCGGRWYFDWVEQAYGPVAKHLGIEYFSSKPDDLPPYVEWIADTAANMEAVEDSSCDLVLSGQNIEHMWPGDQVGFFLEAARVVKPGGWLVVDAPNRSITKQLVGSHPEHMVELTVE